VTARVNVGTTVNGGDVIVVQPTKEPLLGAHMSISGGFDRAVERACDVGCRCLQIFTKNNNQWRAKLIAAEESSRFQRQLAARRIVHPLAHASYLLNLASPDQTLWKKSLDALVNEMQRIEQLHIRCLVIHPGAYCQGSERQGLRLIATALNEMDRQTRPAKTVCLLETTAGQGTSIGWRFEHLAELLQRVKTPERFGVCFDTCHVFAAGYPLAGEKEYRATFRQFDKLVGLRQIKAFHLNDSKRPLGSRVDRHEHIGRGHLGCEAFRLLLNDQRFAKIPKYLETPKEHPPGKVWDKINLRRLKRLIDK
jgi:deoxyribonuclease-4